MLKRHYDALWRLWAAQWKLVHRFYLATCCQLLVPVANLGGRKTVEKLAG